MDAWSENKDRVVGVSLIYSGFRVILLHVPGFVAKK